MFKVVLILVAAAFVAGGLALLSFLLRWGLLG